MSWSRARVGRALMHGFRNNDQSYLAYLLPPEQADGDHDEVDEGDAVSLEWVREYAYELKRDDRSARKDVPYVFAMGGDTVTYNPIESRIAMSRKHFRTRAARPSQTTVTRVGLDDDDRDRIAKRRELLLVGDPTQLRLTHRAPEEAADAEPEQPLLQDVPAGGAGEGREGDAGAGSKPGGGDDDDDDDKMIDDDED